MGWQERQYGDGGSGGFGAFIRRIFGDGENPLTWSLPLYRLWGIGVRIHIFYVVFIIAEIIRTLNQGATAAVFLIPGIFMLFVLVLLHEYGHCIACRKVDGEADKIIMWPLGGLAFCMPPHTWQAHLITAIGGPLVNVILFPILALAVFGATGSWSPAFAFNPFAPGDVIASLNTRAGQQTFWLFTLWWAHYMNIVLLAFNMLVPMYPMDAGRVLHAILWRSMSYNRAMKIVTTVGIVAAGVMAVFGLVYEEFILVAIAFFGGVTCYMEKRRMAFEGAGEFEGYDFSRGYAGMPGDDKPKREGRAAQRRAKQAEKDQVELDRLLAKIAREGMGKLSRGERRFLERESSKKRMSE